MSTAASTRTHTRTRTATYLADVIMGAVGDILGVFGIDASLLWRDWDQDESAISGWIDEGSLNEVILECHRPDGTVAPVFEFPISYDVTGQGDARFVDSRAALARYRAKICISPLGHDVPALFCTFNDPRTPQPGWSPGSPASTERLRSTSFGSLAEAPHARTNLRCLT